MLMLMTSESNWMPLSKRQKKGFRSIMKGLTSYFNRVKYKMQNKHRFLAILRPKIKKFCVVRTYTNIEEVVTAIVEIERVLGELGEIPYKPMKEEQEETMFGESITDHQLHVLNDTLINFFRKGIHGKAGPNSSISVSTNNHCQLCRLGEHTALACPKLADTRPKCAK